MVGSSASRRHGIFLRPHGKSILNNLPRVNVAYTIVVSLNDGQRRCGHRRRKMAAESVEAKVG